MRLKLTINHLAENTKSYQLIKSVLMMIQKVSIREKFLLDKKAQKTNGYQLSKHFF